MNTALGIPYSELLADQSPPRTHNPRRPLTRGRYPASVSCPSRDELVVSSPDGGPDTDVPRGLDLRGSPALVERVNVVEEHCPLGLAALPGGTHCEGQGRVKRGTKVMVVANFSLFFFYSENLLFIPLIKKRCEQKRTSETEKDSVYIL